jgi:hypothetical protein
MVVDTLEEEEGGSVYGIFWAKFTLLRASAGLLISSVKATLRLLGVAATVTTERCDD